MRHAFIDSYANLDTALHRIDAKKKIICLAVFLLVIIFTPIEYFFLFLLYGLAVSVLFYLSRLPIRLFFSKFTELLPFIILIAAPLLFKKSGYELFLNCIVKAILASALLLIVSSTTKFTALLEALKKLKLAKLFIDLLAFMYRYSFLLEDQFLRTKRAYASRCVNQKENFKNVKILSNMLGAIFIRTYERAEKVYLAMCARGYQS